MPLDNNAAEIAIRPCTDRKKKLGPDRYAKRRRGQRCYLQHRQNSRGKQPEDIPLPDMAVGENSSKSK